VVCDCGGGRGCGEEGGAGVGSIGIVFSSSGLMM